MILVVVQVECFVQSEEFVRIIGGELKDLHVFGEESNPTTWKLAKMNLAIRGIDSDLGPHQGDTFTNDLHKGVRFDYILANPPFNIKNWGGEKLQEDAPDGNMVFHQQEMQIMPGFNILLVS